MLHVHLPSNIYIFGVQKSTGRGGAGNMQPTSHSRDARPDLGPNDYSTPRGREPVAKPSSKVCSLAFACHPMAYHLISVQVYTTGRGGAGNLQYSAQAPHPDSSFTETEREVIKEHVNAQESANVSQFTFSCIVNAHKVSVLQRTWRTW